MSAAGRLTSPTSTMAERRLSSSALDARSVSWGQLARFAADRGGIRDSPNEERRVVDRDRIEGELKEQEGKLTDDEVREKQGQAQEKKGEAEDKLDDLKDEVEERF
jgi:uncharacterized protein YjbJ (UPF0337 family)